MTASVQGNVDRRPVREGASAPSQNRPVRGDLPGSLDHMGDVDEFDAALIRGAGGMPVEEDVTERAEQATERDEESSLEAEQAELVPSGGGRGGGRGGLEDGGGSDEDAFDGEAPVRLARPHNRGATASSASCAPAGPSFSACSGRTAARSARPPPSCSASWPSPGLPGPGRLGGPEDRQLHPLTPDALRHPLQCVLARSRAGRSAIPLIADRYATLAASLICLVIRRQKRKGDTVPLRSLPSRTTMPCPVHPLMLSGS